MNLPSLSPPQKPLDWLSHHHPLPSRLHHIYMLQRGLGQRLHIHHTYLHPRGLCGYRRATTMADSSASRKRKAQHISQSTADRGASAENGVEHIVGPTFKVSMCMLGTGGHTRVWSTRGGRGRGGTQHSLSCCACYQCHKQRIILTMMRQAA